MPDYSGLYAHTFAGLEDYWIDIPSYWIGIPFNTAKVDCSTYGIGDNYKFVSGEVLIEERIKNKRREGDK